MMHCIDLNSDLGEGFGQYKLGDTSAILDLVSSANLACGFHAGDPLVMDETVRLCAEKNVAIGAHIGYPDLQGFGRRSMGLSFEELYTLTLYQLGALDAFTRVYGTRVRHINGHGALGNLAQKDLPTARAIVRAAHDFDPAIKIAAPNRRSCLAVAAAEYGTDIITDMFYFDRNLDEALHLVPRGTPGAMVEDEEYALGRVLRAITENRVYAVTGKDMEIPPPKRILIHGDQPNALLFAQKLRKALEASQINICYYSDMPDQSR